MEQLIVSPNPHIHCGRTTQKIMLDVIIALSPVVVCSVLLFGWRALLLYATCVLGCVGFEMLWCLVAKKKQSVGDLSAVVTGLILASNLPVNFPLWMAVIGCLIAIVVVKQMFGGIGCNFANPAIVARVVLMLSFTAAMSSYPTPHFFGGVDGIASATVLPILKGAAQGADSLPTLLQMFVGERAGCLGETCVVAILAGYGYLLIRRVVNPAATIGFVGTAALLFWLLGDRNIPNFVWYELMGGGLLFGACFMATDYPTTPVTSVGKLIFGIGCGLVTVVIRLYGNLPEGVSFSILLMNVLTPLIDRFTGTHPFGAVKQRKAKPAKEGSK